MDDRIARLCERKHSSFCPELFEQRKAVFERVYEVEQSRPLIIRKAIAIRTFLQEKKIMLQEDDLLAGYHQSYDQSPLIDRSVLFQTDDPEQLKDIRFFQTGIEMGLYMEGLGGHLVPDYTEIFAEGVEQRTRKVEALQQKSTGRQQEFYESQTIIGKGIEEYIRRYADTADALSRTVSDQVRQQELKRIYLACNHISSQPPRSFFEAVQLFWLLHEILTIEQKSGSLSPGRFDQFVYPYYKTDIENNTITREEAYQIIQALWIKFNDEQDNQARLSYQNIILGGQKADGSDAVNDLSFLCLEATRTLPFPQPSLSVRICEQTSTEFLNAVITALSAGKGMPSIFNDAVNIASKVKLGVDEADARNFAVIGCVEHCVPGMEYSHTEGLRINLAKVVELILNQGTCSVTGLRLPLLEEYAQDEQSFTAFQHRFQQELARIIRIGARVLDKMSSDFCKFSPYPFASFIMKDCHKTGRDLTDKGVTYNFLSINGIGLANTADSLMTIQQLVFDEKKLGLNDLNSILIDDFRKDEWLRQYILHRIPKFGNDCDAVDDIAKETADFFCDEVMKCRTSIDSPFQAGLHSVGAHADFGKQTGALPDGRQKGDSLANSLSPGQGRDTKGPTAVINSLTRLDHTKIGNGMVLDLKFHPHFLKNGRQDRLKDLILVYFSLGGMEIQFNIIDGKTLKAAQTDPERYPSLIIRVSGFSAYFTQLPTLLQNEIIARTEYSLN